MDKTNHKKVGNCVSPNCLHHCHGVGGWEAGTLIGVKNYKSLVKSGQNVHWATLHCLQLPELLQQLPLNRRQVQWTAINSLKVPTSFFVQNFQ